MASVKISINGQAREIDHPCTLATLLESLGLKAQQVAVELNTQLVPREKHAQTKLEPNDELEIVTLVGGG